MSDYFSERVDGPTPSGGAYLIRYFNAARPEDATEVIIVEYDENDEMIAETFGTVERPPEARHRGLGKTQALLVIEPILAEAAQRGLLR